MLNLDNYYSDDRFMGYTGNRINMSINKIKINSGMFTFLIINNTSENVNENNISENSSLLFHTEFNNTLSGVSLPFSFDNIDSYTIYKKREDEIQYRAIEHKTISNSITNHIEQIFYCDRIVQSGYKYNYKIVLSSDNDITLNAVYKGNDIVEFDGYYISDGETEYHGFINLSVVPSRNIDATIIKTLYSDKPFVIYPTPANYNVFNIDTNFIERNVLTYVGYDVDNTAPFREKVIDFLTNHRAKLLRLSDGRMSIVTLSSSTIQNQSNGYIDNLLTNYEMTEIADGESLQELYNYGFSNYNPTMEGDV